ncbi:methylated-DNA--[protein]-cysteine S-methyltransferase [Rhodoferax sp.]|uniref:methylated-DNA--[protein]-cysteine S-methyltransferase n=1 Tax=Rhodoferax sp. TaxID=50421 RepID=UPI0026296560|nr:methylated-DNA--[protein]-cysteine S-methyltransferase [Rhodoferax sp.]MDD5479838.1 methylated-DNA--[protein]-cysteine S-methyltransferase [Rhodoferax sp.]
MKLPIDAVTTSFNSPLGAMRLAAHANGLCGVWFEDQTDCPPAQPNPAKTPHPVLQSACQQLTEYFAGQRQRFDLPLSLTSDTAFGQAVWHALLGLGWGQTCSYGALSATLGQPRAVRAVGGAIGRNPISIIVPCHRVLGAHGALTGYSGGLARKTALLQLEGVL